jgi:hypothetical protein
VRLLLDRGADLNAKDEDGGTNNIDMSQRPNAFTKIT